MNMIKTYTLENDFLKIKCLNLGAAITEFIVKDKDIDIILAHSDNDAYKTNFGSHGVVVGRNANRIENAEVLINNAKYNLEVNNFHNNLHTGTNGIHFKYLDVKEAKNSLIFSTVIKHLEDGFPGDLNIKITYELIDNKFKISYEAKSNMDTIVNVTNHSYFNLNGIGSSNVHNHNLLINSNFYMPNNEFGFPTGEIINVKNTGFDFTTNRLIKDNLEKDDDQIKQFNGIDHNYLINNDDNDFVASIVNDDDSITMNVYSDQSAMHLYTANHFPDDLTIGKNNEPYPHHGGVAFETQLSPNSLQMPWLKSPILKANDIFESYTTFEIITK